MPDAEKDVVVPAVFLEMLVESGVLPLDHHPMFDPGSGDSKSGSDILVMERRCCDDIVEDVLNGMYVCCGCGKIIDDKMFIYYQPYQARNTFSNQHQRPVGSEGHVTFVRKRFYQPLTHFKEHLRRYMGARFTEIPDDVVAEVARCLPNIAHDPDAHGKVKAILKRQGRTKLYKEIFTIIYMAGGKAPHLDTSVYLACIEDFKKLMYHFVRCRDQWKRYSMPSMYMLLDLLLHANGHRPFYNFPHLKNLKLREQVQMIYDELRTKVIDLSNLSLK